VGNFNKTIPSDEQYKMTKQLVEWIKEKHPDIEIKAHRDFQNHTCP
jgi:N-acetyl-anhydromuramyl-L-alanine amidase AmpD